MVLTIENPMNPLELESDLSIVQNELNIMSMRRHIGQRLIDSFDGVEIVTPNNKPKRSIMQNQSEIINAISRFMINQDQVIITNKITESIPSGTRNKFVGNLILDIEKDGFYITNSAVNYPNRAYPKEIGIIIETKDKTYIFNTINLSVSNNTGKVKVAIPKKVMVINKKNNPIVSVDFNVSSVCIYWDNKSFYVGRLSNISQHSVWVEFNKTFFNDSYYSLLSSSAINGKGIILPATIDMYGVSKFCILKISEISKNGDFYNAEFDFLDYNLKNKNEYDNPISNYIKETSDSIELVIDGDHFTVVDVFDGGKDTHYFTINTDGKYNNGLEFIDQLDYFALINNDLFKLKYHKDVFCDNTNLKNVFELNFKNGDNSLTNKIPENIEKDFIIAKSNSIDYMKKKVTLNIIE